jgi:membrane-associated phospholipid phosphatase
MRPSRVSFATVSAGAVAVLAVWIAEEGTVPGERRVLIRMHDASGTTLDRVAQATNDITNVTPLVVVAAGVLIALLVMRRWREAAYFLAAVAVVWSVNPVLKEIVRRTRPELWPLPESVSQYGFPSGHAANTAALIGGLVMILRTRRARVIGAAVGAVVLVIVGLSQLILGLHYPSDLVAGWLWAFAWISVLWNKTKGGPG